MASIGEGAIEPRAQERDVGRDEDAEEHVRRVGREPADHEAPEPEAGHERPEGQHDAHDRPDGVRDGDEPGALQADEQVLHGADGLLEGDGKHGQVDEPVAAAALPAHRRGPGRAGRDEPGHDHPDADELRRVGAGVGSVARDLAGRDRRQAETREGQEEERERARFGEQAQPRLAELPRRKREERHAEQPEQDRLRQEPQRVVHDPLRRGRGRVRRLVRRRGHAGEVSGRAAAVFALPASRARRRRFQSSPPEYPPIRPPDATTRWHGITMATGFFPHARPTARAAPGDPTAVAISP